LSVSSNAKNILVVEDNQDDLMQISRTLKNENYTLKSATSLKYTSELIENIKIDLILCDLNIDDSQGLNTFSYLKSKFEKIPIVILSGYSDDALALRAVQGGAQDYIPKKELDSPRFLSLIKFALERSDLLQRIKDSEKLAVRQSEFKSKFLSHFSHEIRTPLNSITSSTSLLEMTKMSAEQAGYVNSLKCGSGRLKTIVNDILDISSIEAGKLKVSMKNCNINSVVNEISTLFMQMARNKNLILMTDISEDVPQSFLTDSKRLIQILSNLIVNAIKFTYSGRVKLSVSKKENKIFFSVEDTGRGIPSEKKENLFQPFMQTQFTDSNEGTGLGLTICKKLTELMGGRIYLADYGPGTKFILEFPVNSGDSPHSLKAEVTNKEIHLKINLENISQIGAKKNCLVVEDEPFSRKLLCTILNKIGFKSTPVNNGKEALEKIHEGKNFHVIFMDFSMPIMNGPESAKEIRKIDKLTPIIATTGNAFDSDKSLCLKAGMNNFLAKPITLESLVQILSDEKVICIEPEKK